MLMHDKETVRITSMGREGVGSFMRIINNHECARHRKSIVTLCAQRCLARMIVVTMRILGGVVHIALEEEESGVRTLLRVRAYCVRTSRMRGHEWEEEKVLRVLLARLRVDGRARWARAVRYGIEHAVHQTAFLLHFVVADVTRTSFDCIPLCIFWEFL